MSPKILEKPDTSASSASTAPTSAEFASAFYGPADGAAKDLQTGSGQPTAKDAAGSSASPKATADPTKTEAKATPEGTATPKAEEEKSAGTTPESGHAVAARRLGNQVKDLTAQLEAAQAQVQTLAAKLDGTYEEPKAPDPKQLEAVANFKGRETASRQLAIDRYGEDVVREKVYGVGKDGKDLPDGSEYMHLVKAEPWVQLDVREHPQPTMRAMQLLELRAFKDKYGDDPAQWIDKIKAEITPLVLEDFKRETAQVPVGSEPPTVTGSRGSGGPEQRERSLEDIFYGGTKKR